MSDRGRNGNGDEPEPPSQDDLQRYVMDVMDWNSYQAAAYVAVVRDGPLEPKDIVAMTEIPQGRVYDVMSSLEGEFVTVQGAQPKRYQAQHPRSVLGDQREAFNEKANAATDHLEQQFEIQRERQTPQHPAWVIPGMSGIQRAILDGIQEAEEGIQLMDRDGKWIGDNEIRDLGRKHSAGVEVEVVGRPQWGDVLSRVAQEVGCRTWSHEDTGCSMVLIDDQQAIIRTERADTGVKIDDNGTVKTLQRAFQATRQDANRVEPDA